MNADKEPTASGMAYVLTPNSKEAYHAHFKILVRLVRFKFGSMVIRR